MAAGRGVGADRQDLGENERAVETEKPDLGELFTSFFPKGKANGRLVAWRGKLTPTASQAKNTVR